MAVDQYDLDPDVIALRRLRGSKQIPTKTSSMSGIRPDLQADAEYDYEQDPDILALRRSRQIKKENKVESSLPDWLRTGLQTGAGIASGIATPIVGGVKGIVQSIPEAISTGQPPAPIAQRIAAEFIQKHPGFTVTDPQAQANLEAIQQAFGESKLPPVFPEAQGFGIKPGEAMTTKVPLRTAANAQDILTQQFAQKVGQGAQAAKDLVARNKVGVRVEPVSGSVGAAAAVPENVLRGNIDAALAGLPEDHPIVAHVKSQPIENVNIPALETRALEEKHGVKLLTSQRTGDTQAYSEAWNKRDKNGLVVDFEQQPKQLAQAFEASKQKHAPDISSTADASELGQIQINALEAKDAARRAAISDAYKALEDANGGQFPIDIGTLDKNIKESLSKKMKTNHLSAETQSDLNDFYKNPTFEQFESLRSNLADEMRSSSDGRKRGAAYIVRQELENLPVFGENSNTPKAAELKALADKARSLYKERQDILKSNPAYRSAVKEAISADEASAQGESLNAAKFHKKYVATATPEAIRRLKAELPENDLAHQAITVAELERAKQAITNANESRVKSDQFANFLRNNKSILRESLPPEAMQDVMEIGLLNSKIGKPDAGTFNYSNTWSSMMGDLAKQGLLGLGEAKLAGATGGGSIPVVGGLKTMYEKMSKDAFANSQRNPIGGLTKE